MKDYMIIGIIIAIVAIVVIIRNYLYEEFILSHSFAIKEIKKLNEKYQFETVKNFDMSHSYDNENFYDDISEKDYLTYNLVYIKKDVIDAIKNAEENRRLNCVYQEEIGKIQLDKYDAVPKLKSVNKLKKTEEKFMKEFSQNPTVDFSIEVCLTLTKINGERRRSKKANFNIEEISDIISRLSQKNGKFYLNDEIWQSISRVERGKVSNKMRFAIYKRDGYRCRICGRKTDDLEIDHIYPIAKGGKTTYDNLQTLCHKCNAKKSDQVSSVYHNER
jgi:DNA-binding transcriptional MerR regulator